MKRTPLVRKTPLRHGKRKSTKARQSARGRSCKVRLPGCDGGGETTVSAHYRLAGYCGVGLKPPDAMACDSCFNCHEAIDGRRFIPGYTREQIRLAHAEGCLRSAAEREEAA